jgi:hypothetical protein
MSEGHITLNMQWTKQDGSKIERTIQLPNFEDLIKERRNRLKTVPMLLKRGLIYKSEDNTYFYTASDIEYLESDAKFYGRMYSEKPSGFVIIIPSSRACGIGSLGAGMSTTVAGLNATAKRKFEEAEIK